MYAIISWKPGYAALEEISRCFLGQVFLDVKLFITADIQAVSGMLMREDHLFLGINPSG